MASRRSWLDGQPQRKPYPCRKIELQQFSAQASLSVPLHSNSRITRQLSINRQVGIGRITNSDNLMRFVLRRSTRTFQLRTSLRYSLCVDRWPQPVDQCKESEDTKDVIESESNISLNASAMPIDGTDGHIH